MFRQKRRRHGMRDGEDKIRAIFESRETRSYECEYVHGLWHLDYHTANFVTVHDGFTMYDVFSYNKKVNGCGPLNPVCCDQPESPFCVQGTESGENNNRSRDWRRCENTPPATAKVRSSGLKLQA